MEVEGESWWSKIPIILEPKITELEHDDCAKCERMRYHYDIMYKEVMLKNDTNIFLVKEMEEMRDYYSRASADMQLNMVLLIKCDELEKHIKYLQIELNNSIKISNSNIKSNLLDGV